MNASARKATKTPELICDEKKHLGKRGLCRHYRRRHCHRCTELTTTRLYYTTYQLRLVHRFTPR